MISEINFQQNFCQTMTQFGKNFIKFCRSFIGLSYFTAGHSIPRVTALVRCNQCVAYSGIRVGRRFGPGKRCDCHARHRPAE